MYQKNAPFTIQMMFNHIAKRYDLTNSVLSLSLHKYWNSRLIRSFIHSSPKVLVDLCAGTGDIAFNYVKKATNGSDIYLIDFSSEMLAHAKEKEKKLNVALHHQISYIEANVEQIPLPNQMADCVTIAYGIRNVQNPELCIQDVFRILKPGGTFKILELTRPKNPLLKMGHLFYLNILLPFFGKCLTKNRNAYHYLSQSIQTFTDPKELQSLLQKTGFEKTDQISLSGGIASLISGQKPK